jgi:bifunctional UDP-N-acetylglucosamine pyrophosphorylase/glucosamine-1-phosphate N-acetyltransferase
MSGLGVIILAAGQGTRMKSALPKVLHPVCGDPMALHVLRAARGLSPQRIAVVVGYEAAKVREALASPDVTFVDQPQQIGTGDAVKRCHKALAGCSTVLVLNGDSPLITTSLLASLVRSRGQAPIALAACSVADTGSFGRVLRDSRGAVKAVVESSAANKAATAERNAGQYVFDGPWLWAHIDGMPLSERGEYYLTHLPALAYAEGTPSITFYAPVDEVMGFDDRRGLAEAERVMRARILDEHMFAGVTIADPATTYIDAAVRIAPDVTILPNCYLYGPTTVGTGTVIGPGTTLRSSTIGEDCRIQSSVIEDSHVGHRVPVGPFAHLRGDAHVGDDCEIGNYAEIKNSVIGRGVKMHHFSYVGDADVGEGTNIAAGTITCNYDGVAKHRTVIGKNVFIGSDTMLIAPVTIGDGASTGAGSVVTRDVAPGETVVGVPAKTFPRPAPGA